MEPTYHDLGVTDNLGQQVHVCDGCDCHFVGNKCPSYTHKATRYFIVAVAEERVDFFVKENLRQDFIYGVKQVVIDAENITEVEVAY